MFTFQLTRFLFVTSLFAALGCQQDVSALELTPLNGSQSNKQLSQMLANIDVLHEENMEVAHSRVRIVSVLNESDPCRWLLEKPDTPSIYSENCQIQNSYLSVSSLEPGGLTTAFLIGEGFDWEFESDSLKRRGDPQVTWQYAFSVSRRARADVAGREVLMITLTIEDEEYRVHIEKNSE